MTFWSYQLILAMLLNGIVQCIQIGAYAARLAGVVSGRIATSISLFNLFVTASRLASLCLTPMLGVLADHSGHWVRDHSNQSAEAVDFFTWQVRLIVAGGTIGTSLGALLLPTFVLIYLRGIAAFERTGSLPQALLRLLDPRVLLSMITTFQLPSLKRFRSFRLTNIPRRLLIGNILVTAIYSIGVVAAYNASVIDIHHPATAIGLSGLINGIATISFTLIVDPTSALITDQAARGERPIAEVKSMIGYLALTAVLGTILSQLILVPAAHIIAYAASFVNGFN